MIGEELHRLVDARAAAGEHSNAVSDADRAILASLDIARKDDEADTQQHDTEQYEIEDEPQPNNEEAEMAYATLCLVYVDHCLLRYSGRRATIVLIGRRGNRLADNLRLCPGHHS